MRLPYLVPPAVLACSLTASAAPAANAAASLPWRDRWRERSQALR